MFDSPPRENESTALPPRPGRPRLSGTHPPVRAGDQPRALDRHEPLARLAVHDRTGWPAEATASPSSGDGTPRRRISCFDSMAAGRDRNRGGHDALASKTRRVVGQARSDF